MIAHVSFQAWLLLGVLAVLLLACGLKEVSVRGREWLDEWLDDRRRRRDGLPRRRPGCLPDGWRPPPAQGWGDDEVPR